MNYKQTIISIACAIVAVAVACLIIDHTVSNSHPETSPVVASGASADFSNSPYFIVNGVTEWYSKQNFNTSSSTICSFREPVAAYSGGSVQTASSTIQFISIRTNSATSTLLNFDIGTSTSPSATSSMNIVKAGKILANATSSGASWFGSTPTGAQNGLYLNGYEYVNVIVDNVGASAGAGITGTCQLETTQF